MKLGCCIADQAQLAVLEDASSDYCELPVASTVMTDSLVFEELLGRLQRSPLLAPACNVFLPGELKVVGPVIDQERLHDYVRTAFGRMTRLGVSVVVVGSGRSRAVPEGFSPERALDQFEAFLRTAAEEAAAHGIVISLEPLRRAETNLLNSVEEGAAFIRERHLDRVRLLADLYHMREEGESLDVLEGCADLLVHTHVAGAGRRPPGPGDADLGAFFGRLGAAGYEGRCSIECQWSDFAAEAPRALAHLRAIAG